MMHFLTRSLFAPAAIAALALATACAEDSKDKGDDDDDDPTAGTSGAGGSSTVGVCSATEDCKVVPDGSGWIEGTTNTIGVQGSWYPYGDQYGVPGKCITTGLHMPADCSEIDTPVPPLLGVPPTMGNPFTNTNGVMCTKGRTAVIKPCNSGVTTEGCPTNDYANMWGAGIGFDLNAQKGEDGGMKSTWDPAAYGIIGFSFDIDQVPLATKLRVEIPVLLTAEEAAAVGLPEGSTTDDHPKGAPYWGATSAFPPSPVQPGTNKILWSNIVHPITTAVTFVPSRMLGIQWHAPAVAAAPKGEYEFCVSNITFLRNP
jgi:hypothetical protein